MEKILQWGLSEAGEENPWRGKNPEKGKVSDDSRSPVAWNTGIAPTVVHVFWKSFLQIPPHPSTSILQSN